jgi:hypothetical protein
MNPRQQRQEHTSVSTIIDRCCQRLAGEPVCGALHVAFPLGRVRAAQLVRDHVASIKAMIW